MKGDACAGNVHDAVEYARVNVRPCVASRSSVSWGRDDGSYARKLSARNVSIESSTMFGRSTRLPFREQALEATQASSSKTAHRMGFT